MSTYSNLNVVRKGNVYTAYLQRIKVFEVFMPRDNQLILDSKCIAVICESIYERCKNARNPQREKKSKKESSDSNLSFSNYSGLCVIQQGINQYGFYIPDGAYIARIKMPMDEKYLEDDKVIKKICKVLARRYNLL